MIGLAVSGLLVFAGCGDDTDSGADAPTTTTATAPAAPDRCMAPTFEVAYPRSWEVNTAEEAAPCRWFHPEEFELPESTDAVGIAISVRYERGSAASLADRADGGAVLDRTRTTIDGGEAIRTHRRSSGQGLLPPGSEVVSWFIDAGPRTLMMTTTSKATDGSFDENVAVVDEMARSFRLHADFACSAAGLHLEDETMSGLPAAVSTTRRRLLDAALACDFRALGETAAAGSRTFTFSFGGGDDPSTYWRDAELRGDDPLRILSALLHLPHATLAGDGTQFVWPTAFAYDTWSAVPEEHRADVRRLYEPEVVEGFRAADAYLGHRVGIADDGEWLFFVAGD